MEKDFTVTGPAIKVLGKISRPLFLIDYLSKPCFIETTILGYAPGLDLEKP
jgi:hypothetical protein